MWAFTGSTGLLALFASLILRPGSSCQSARQHSQAWFLFSLLALGIFLCSCLCSSQGNKCLAMPTPPRFKKNGVCISSGNTKQFYMFNRQILPSLHSYFYLVPVGQGPFQFLNPEAEFIIGRILSLNAQSSLELLQSDKLSDWCRVSPQPGKSHTQYWGTLNGFWVSSCYYRGRNTFPSALLGSLTSLIIQLI